VGRKLQHTFAEYNQQDATFHNFFISVRRSTCFRPFFRPEPGAQNCTYSVRYLSDRYCYLLLASYMFQAGFPSIIRSSKLHIQRQVFVRPLLLPAASQLHVSDGFSVHHQELKTAHTASDICQTVTATCC